MLQVLQHLLQDKGIRGFRKLDCIKEVRHKLDLPLTFLYYEHAYRPSEMKTNLDIQNIFRQARSSLMQLLAEKSNFLNTERLRSETNNTQLNLGNQPQTLRNSHIRNLFHDIPPLEPDNFYINHLHLLRHRMITSLRRLEHERHVMYSPYQRVGYSSNPFYDERRNITPGLCPTTHLSSRFTWPLQMVHPRILTG